MGRLLVVPDRSPESPVARLRAAAFAAELGRRGVAAVLLENTLPLAHGRRLGMALPVVRAVAGLRRQLRDLRRGDVLYLVRIQQIPGLPRWCIRQARRAGARIVFDFDDAVHLDDPRSTRRLCEAADHVVVGSRGLAPYVETLQRPCTWVPTPVDPDAFRPRAEPDRVVGWMGTPSNLPFLRAIHPALVRVRERAGAPLRVVTRPLSAVDGHAPAGSELVAWDLDGYRDQVARFAVGVSPLPDTPWTRGKLGYKAIEYQAAGVPAVVSPLLRRDDVVLHGRTGYYADGGAQWEEALLAVLEDPARRSRMAKAARAHAVASFSVTAAVDRLEPVVRGLLG